jgi:Galactose oxidase, central domain
MSAWGARARRAGVLALLLAAANSACSDEPELTLEIRLPPDDQGQFRAVTQLNLTASRDDVVLAQRSFSANTSSVSLTGVSHGPRTIITLEGVDSSNQVIAFGQTCPVVFEGPNTREPLYFAPTNFFAPTADTPAARYHPVGAALSDGTVVLVGGNDQAGAALSTVELFQPGAATFSAVQDPAVARKDAESAVLPDVGLLIVGGLGADGTPVANAEVFLDTQRLFVTIADQRLGRIGHQVVTLPDGRALVTGGMARETPAGETAPAVWTTLGTALYVAVMEDGTYKVSPAPTLAEPRSRHAATVAIGTPIVFGGYDVNGLPLDSIEAVDIGYGSSQVIGRLKTPRAEATASVLPDGSILLVGGTGPDGLPLADAELFNPITRSTERKELGSPRHGHTATVLPDGRVLVAGGIMNGEPLAGVELFRPDYGVFVNERPLGTPRAQHLALRLCDETVLLMGGGTGAELYTSTPR